METTIQYQGNRYKIDLSKPIDISLPIQDNPAAANAWYCPPANFSPVMNEHFVGDVNQGGAVNFMNISFNPHGNGTHTECVGHISSEFVSINDVMKRFFFPAQLISIQPVKKGNDSIITFEQIQAAFLTDKNPEAFIIRTLPNDNAKTTRQYSNINPPFVEAEAMNWLYKQGVRHFLIDTPSVDKESDGGKLAAHHAFWNYPESPRLDATISEFIYAPNTIIDGIYMLNLQIAAFENDAAPSKPTLYALI